MGLRARIVAALVATSAVTLAVAAVALFSPLQSRLNTEQLETLEDTAQAARGSFGALKPHVLRPGSPVLARDARALSRRTDARVAVLDARLTPLTDTDPDGPPLAAVAARALRRDHTEHQARGSGPDTVADVAVPVRIDGRDFVLALRKSLRETETATDVVKRAFITAALVGLAVAVLLGSALATRLVRRLRRLRDASAVIARLGPDAEVHPDHARDEVGDLTRALSTMHDRLRHQEEARRTFVSTASHELRTPIASLHLMLENLEADLHSRDVDLAAASEEVERARAQARRLDRLAADLLDLSRLDADVPLRHEPVDVHELCRAVIAEFEATAAERGLSIAFPSGDPECRAMADPGGVARTLRILLDNALRFAPPSDPVRVEIAGAGGRVQIAVTDAGPGVPEDEREQIFERFRRGTETGGEAGFGLGLAIGHELARRMGGDLTLARSGAGARFVLELEGAPALARR